MSLAVGDKVRVTSSLDSAVLPVGTEGTVIDIVPEIEGAFYFEAENHDRPLFAGNGWPLYENEVEKIEETA